MDERRIRHHKVTFTVVLVMTYLMFAIVLDSMDEVVTWHAYACLALAYATACFVAWRI